MSYQFYEVEDIVYDLNNLKENELRSYTFKQLNTHREM